MRRKSKIQTNYTFIYNMNKISSLFLILLTMLAFTSCDKEDNDVNKPGVNNGKRLLKTVYYDENDNESSVEEWTYGNNFTCVTTYEDGEPISKREHLISGNASSEQYFTWSDGNWNLQSETITKMNSQGRIQSIESRLGNPSYHTDLGWYTYSGDSTIVVSSTNGQVNYKTVTVQNGNTTESIRYSYLGDYQWKEYEYRKTVVTFTDGDNGKPHSTVIYDREGNVIFRYDYVWNGQNYKVYLTSNGVRRLQSDVVRDGNTTTQIRYWTNTDNEMPLDKTVIKEMGNTIEKCNYSYFSGTWVLARKKVDYYEDTSK